MLQFLGNWADWQVWSSCSQTCGTGIRSRNRICNGNGCMGISMEKDDCITRFCPGNM